ncbi:MAG: hypothetical protein NWE88_11175 [Candidatus Bathyarchaeota archaeon]|nr:hypothetical protein [Candidatus Bathyarchaeota archaeon]
MVYFSKVREHKDESLVAAKQDSFDIPEGGIIDTIIPFVRSYNASDTQVQMYQYIFHELTAIELIANGKTPLFSLTGDQLLARYFHDHGKLPPSTLESYGNCESFIMMPMYFGRHMKDPEYGLDASKFSDLKLKITNSVTSTLFATDTLTVDVDIIYQEDRPSPPAKYMLPYEYEAYTPATNTESKRIELPDRVPMRKIWITMDRDVTVSTAGYTCHPFDLVNKMKFTLKNRTQTVLDETYERLLPDMPINVQDWEHYGEVHMRNVFASASQKQDLFFAYPQNVQLTVQTQDTNTGDIVNFHSGQERRLGPRGVTGSNVQCACTVQGWGILDSFMIMDQTKLGEANYLDPDKIKPAHLEFTSVQNDGEIQVCVEEVWPN